MYCKRQQHRPQDMASAPQAAISAYPTTTMSSRSPVLLDALMAGTSRRHSTRRIFTYIFLTICGYNRLLRIREALGAGTMVRQTGNDALPSRHGVMARTTTDGR